MHRFLKTQVLCDLFSWIPTLFRFAGGPALSVVLVTASTAAFAQDNTIVPDAQVESNVLRLLATAPELASEAITTKTVYGTVTLSGIVKSESLRQRAETLAANAPGVKKVIDQLTLTDAQNSDTSTAIPGAVLPPSAPYTSDPRGLQTPTASATLPQRNDPDADQELDRQIEAHQQTRPQSNQGPSTVVSNERRPIDVSAYPLNSPAYPPYPQQPGYDAHGYAPPMDGGQAGGQAVVVPNRTLVRVRVNQNLSSDRSQRGTSFDGIVINDVVAGGLIAIPRGAAVHGTVIEAKPSGTLKGRGEMTLQLNDITLAGRTYPIVSDTWSHHGGDKTIESVNKTLGLGAVGAIIGAVAGGGVGAAVGGGVGAAAGLGSSAASGRGQVYVPSEAVITFHLAEPAQIHTVSEQEMQRLAYGVTPGADQRYARRIYQRPYPYYAPYPPYPPPY